MIRTATLLLLLAGAARAADDDARFKPKTYVPSKPAQNRAYQPAEYAPAKALSTSAPATGKSAEPARRSIWNFFKAKPFESTPERPAAPAAEAAPYAQSQQITVPTMTPDRKAINMDEHKPYIEGESKLQAAGYTPPEKPREQNPLLAPRQDIKEHP